ncbi:MAG: amino acid ABC transporter ATP-binding protein [Acidobacteriota bacterium]|nr:amino acid ABC transporter ATP-binding protein [Acidobacteriota bacterium]MDE3139412.1 amino acid ABC transporter ATP-binding protein [Acidobacteriota bacterium]MDE3147544.1 amino acid ABC transporter ATP-binding protein [Acidobacteriota bacterium]
MTTPVLQAWRVSKSFGAERAVDQVSLSVQAGTATCILGPSGAGKSTFIRCLNFLERPEDGYVFIDGDPLGFDRRGDVFHEISSRRLARQRQKVGMVFQQFNLFEHMSAIDNVIEAPCGVRGVRRADAIEKGMELLRKVGLAHKAHSLPRELSGGQQQRVAIARALAMEPRLLLCDEPTSALDPEMVHEVLNVLGELVAEGMTMIAVTHEVGFAREVAHRFVFMERGAVIEEGPSSNLSVDGVREDRTRSFLEKVL